jgi:hypothetical protein
LSLRDDTSVSTGTTGELIVQGRCARVIIKRLGPGTLAALRQLSSPGADEEQLNGVVLQTDGPGAVARFA